MLVLEVVLLPVWRGVVKNNSILIAAQNPYATDNQKTTMTVRYQNWQHQIELTGRQVYLCQFDLSIITGNEALSATVRLFPNPVTDKLTIEWPSSVNKSTEISVINQAGQVVKQQPLIEGHNLRPTQQTTLSVSDLPPGLYFIKLQSGQNQVVKRFFKIE